MRSHRVTAVHAVVVLACAATWPLACSTSSNSSSPKDGGAPSQDAGTKTDATVDAAKDAHADAGATTAVGLVVDTNAAPLAGVTLTVGKATVTTAADGSFSLPIAPGSPDVLAFRKTGYVGRTLTYGVVTGQQLQLYVEMLAETPPQSLDATAGGTVTGPRGSSLTIPPNSLVDSTGKLVTGTVQVSLTPVDPSVPAQLATYPAGLGAANSSGQFGYLASYGVLEIQVTQGTETLNLKPGATAAALIPAPSADASPPATTDMWSLNETTGVWKQEQGTATLDTSTHLYALALPHLSAWNCDTWAAPGCIFGQLFDQHNKTIQGASIIADFNDKLSSGTGQSGPDGYFCMSMGVDTSGTTLDFYPTPLTKPALFYPKFIGGLPNKEVTESVYLCNDPTQCAQLGKVTINTSVAPVLDGGTVIVDGGFTPGEGGAANGAGPACTLGTDAGATPTMDGGFAMTPLPGCLAGLNKVFECFAPSGGCTTTPVSMTSIQTKWSNGSALQWMINGSLSTGSLTGPTGTSCGQLVTTGVGGTTITDTSGNAWMFAGGDAGADAGQVVTCEPAGGMATQVTLSPADSNTASACTGNFGAGAGGGCPLVNPVGAPCPGGATQCTTVAPICCPGKAGALCMPSASVCSTYTANGCGSSTDCTGGDSCCQITGSPFPLCLPESCGNIDGGVSVEDAGGGSCTQAACTMKISDAFTKTVPCSISATYYSTTGTSVIITATSGTFSASATVLFPNPPSAETTYSATNARISNGSVSQSFDGGIPDGGTDATTVVKGWSESFSADAGTSKENGSFQLSLTSLGTPTNEFGLLTYTCINGTFTGTLTSEQQPDGGPFAQVQVTF